MERHKLSAPDVAKIMRRKANTVRIWRMANSHRVISDDTLELLEIRLAQRKAGE